MHILEQYIGGAWVQLAKTDNEKDIKDICEVFGKVTQRSHKLNYYTSSNEVVSTSFEFGPIRLRKIEGE